MIVSDRFSKKSLKISKVESESESKNRPHSGQNITHKTKDQVTRIPLKYFSSFIMEKKNIETFQKKNVHVG